MGYKDVWADDKNFYITYKKGTRVIQSKNEINECVILYIGIYATKIFEPLWKTKEECK